MLPLVDTELGTQQLLVVLRCYCCVTDRGAGDFALVVRQALLDKVRAVHVRQDDRNINVSCMGEDALEMHSHILCSALG